MNFLVICVPYMVMFLECANFVGGISVEQDLTLTMSQKKSLDMFRERVSPLLEKEKDHLKTDLYLIRWLRARNFDLNAAERMLREHLRWRKDNNIDKILEEDWSDMKKDYPASVDTYDKEGRPVGNLDMSDWDMRRAVLQGNAPRVLRYLYHFLENATQQIFERQAKGLNVTQWSLLGSADGFNLIQHGCPACIPYWIQYVQTVENHYNGWMDAFIIIDAPPSISVILESVRPFLTPQTREAFKIFGPNKARWMAYLDGKIDRDQRRVQHGGTKPPLTF